MRIAIKALVIVVLVLVGIAWYEEVQNDQLASSLRVVRQELKARNTACDYLLGEVRSAVRLGKDHEIKIKDDGTIVIFHRVSATRWEFPPDGLHYSVYMPTR